MLLLSLLSLVVGGLTVVGLLVVGGSLVARPAAEILAPGGGGVPRLVTWGALGWAAVAVAAGGFVTAWTAPRAPVRHTLLLGLIAAAVAPLAPVPGVSGAAGAGVVRAGVALAAALLGGWASVLLRGSGEEIRPEP